MCLNCTLSPASSVFKLIIAYVIAWSKEGEITHSHATVMGDGVVLYLELEYTFDL